MNDFKGKKGKRLIGTILKALKMFGLNANTLKDDLIKFLIALSVSKIKQYKPEPGEVINIYGGLGPDEKLYINIGLFKEGHHVKDLLETDFCLSDFLLKNSIEDFINKYMGEE